MGILPWIQRMNFRGNYLVPYLPVYPAASLRVSSIRLSLSNLSTSLFVSLSIGLPLYWSPSLLVSLSIGLPLYRSTSLSVSLSTCLSLSVCFYMSTSLPDFWSASLLVCRYPSCCPFTNLYYIAYFYWEDRLVSLHV